MARKGVDVDRKRRKETARIGAIGGAAGAAGYGLGGAISAGLGRPVAPSTKGAALSVGVPAAAMAGGANVLHRRVHGTNKNPTGRTKEPKNFRELINDPDKKKVKKSMDPISAFGVDHGVISKAFSTGASAKVVGQLGRSQTRGDKGVALGMIRQGIKGAPRTTGARERALNSGAVRAERLGARIRHRENYPGSKNLAGFPRKPLP